MKLITLIIALTLAAPFAYPAAADAGAPIPVPPGTQVPLRFVTGLDSATVKQGDAVQFGVALDVVVDRVVVIKAGTPAQGLIKQIDRPGIFGRNARVTISLVQVAGVDGAFIGLADIVLSPDRLREARDTGGAVGAGGAGLILLGPVGLAAGALVRGGELKVPAGLVAIANTSSVVEVNVP